MLFLLTMHEWASRHLTSFVHAYPASCWDNRGRLYSVWLILSLGGWWWGDWVQPVCLVQAHWSWIFLWAFMFTVMNMVCSSDALSIIFLACNPGPAPLLPGLMAVECCFNLTLRVPNCPRSYPSDWLSWAIFAFLSKIWYVSRAPCSLDHTHRRDVIVLIFLYFKNVWAKLTF